MNSYRWCLRALMNAQGIEETSKLQPLLRDRGVELSREQVFRLVKYEPERLSMRTLVALCHIFDCTPSDLINVSAPSLPRRPKKSRTRPKIPVTRVTLHS
jgi:DNA-binding Xre family transcriptional regulator